MEGDGRRHEHQARIFLRPVGSALPLADEAFQGFGAQLGRLESEPGVRQQL